MHAEHLDPDDYQHRSPGTLRDQDISPRWKPWGSVDAGLPPPISGDDGSRWLGTRMTLGLYNLGNASGADEGFDLGEGELAGFDEEFDDFEGFDF